MKRLIAWLWRKLARKVERHYDARLIAEQQAATMVAECRAVEVFCNKSGFLRDGRYPGGRHAERKIRRSVGLIFDSCRAMFPGPWCGP